MEIVAYADDNTTARMYVSGKLRSAGYEVKVFSTVEDLLASTLEGVAVIVLDDSFGEGRLSGLEAIPRILKKHPEAKIVMFTASTLPRGVFTSAGAKRVVDKLDFSGVEILIQTLKRLLKE